MNSKTLLNALADLEREMHSTSTRKNRTRMEQLLHPEFMEFGRSGRLYNRQQILEEFRLEGQLPPVHASEFRLITSGDDTALLTYFSAHETAPEGLQRQTRRSSLWVRESGNWRLRFHQGTPLD